MSARAISMADSADVAAGVSRGAGALVVCFASGALAESIGVAQGRTAVIASIRRSSSRGWRLRPTGRVTAYTGKCELGQGMYTAQVQLIAEELSRTDRSRVRLVQCDTSITPDQGTTSGSQSTPTNFNDRNLALAAATAREALLQRASARLGVPVEQLSIDRRRRRRSTGDRVQARQLRRAGRRQTLALPLNPDGEAEAGERMEGARHLGARASTWRRMVTGQFEFVHNVRVRRHAARPRGAAARRRARRSVSVDERSVAGLPGFVKVVVRKNFVGVVCEKPWQAIQAARALKATWSPGPALPPQDGFYDHMRRQPARNTLRRGFR